MCKCGDTLQRNFGAAIKRGREHGKQSLKRMQFKAAEEGNAALLIWLGKQYLGQKDKVETEHTGKDGGPIAVNVSHRVTSFDWESFRQELAYQKQRAVESEGGGDTQGDGA